MMIVCVKCRRFFRPKKNGFVVEEGMPGGHKFVDEASSWGAYKLWHADLLACPDCETQIVAGFGRKPISEHFMSDYTAWRERYPPQLFIPDCC